MESVPPPWVRRNFVFGPATFTTGCNPIVLVTTPPHPASNARRMLLSDSVGGADESRNGFSKRMPVKVVDRSGAMRPPPRRDDEGGRRLRIVLFRRPEKGGPGQAAVGTASRRRPPAMAPAMDPTSIPVRRVRPIQSVICGNSPIKSQVWTGPMAGKFGGSAS